MEPLRVDVWSDLVCPWCHIGLHRLRRVAREAGVPVEIAHHAFQLDPGRRVSAPTREALGQRYGPGNVDAMFAQATQAARAEGLELRLADSVACDTRDGHRLVAWAGRQGPAAAEALVDRLMRAHFGEGADLGDRATLARLAGEAGLPAAEAAEVLADGRGDDDVEADLDGARAWGIRGVPFFVVGGRLAFSGAQPDAVFREAFRRAREPAATA